MRFLSSCVAVLLFGCAIEPAAAVEDPDREGKADDPSDPATVAWALYSRGNDDEPDGEANYETAMQRVALRTRDGALEITYEIYLPHTPAAIHTAMARAYFLRERASTLREVAIDPPRAEPLTPGPVPAGLLDELARRFPNGHPEARYRDARFMATVPLGELDGDGVQRGDLLVQAPNDATPRFPDLDLGNYPRTTFDAAIRQRVQWEVTVLAGEVVRAEIGLRELSIEGKRPGDEIMALTYASFERGSFPNDPTLAGKIEPQR